MIGSGARARAGPDVARSEALAARCAHQVAVQRPAAAAMLELMRAVVAGELPPPPIAQLLQMSLDGVSEGRAVFALAPAEWMYNPIGSVHGGVAATILDSCMGCAVHTLLPAGVGYSTADLQIRYLRGISSDTGRVRAEGTVVHAGRRLMTAEGRLVVERPASCSLAGRPAASCCDSERDDRRPRVAIAGATRTTHPLSRLTAGHRTRGREPSWNIASWAAPDCGSRL